MSETEIKLNMPNETSFNPFKGYRNNLARKLLIEPINLMKISSSRMSRNLRGDFTPPKINHILSKNMVTRREDDHSIFYLTETNKLRNISRTNIFVQEEKKDLRKSKSKRKQSNEQN